MDFEEDYACFVLNIPFIQWFFVMFVLVIHFKRPITFFYICMFIFDIIITFMD